MGIFSAIGSAISGALSAVSSFASTALSTISNAVSSFASTALSGFGKIVGGLANGFMSIVSKLPLGPLGPILGPIVGELIVKAVVKVIEILSKKLGLIEEDDKAEEIGYRVEESEKHDDWKKPDDFKTFAEYYSYLKQQIPDELIDRAKLNNAKDYYAVLGTMAETYGLEKELEIKFNEEFLVEIGRSKMTAEEIRAFADAFRSLGFESIDVADYFKGNLPPGESKRITEALISSMQKFMPEKTEDELYARINEIQAAARGDLKLRDDIYKDELIEIAETKKLPEITE
ncbi:MAG: hypothetical protein IJ728_04540 [Selenomonadaceae bacterium]|nr:hypothetical protein [Selenomonadaceae bacterium]